MYADASENIPVTSAEANVANWRWYVEAVVYWDGSNYMELQFGQKEFIGVLKGEKKEGERQPVQT